MSTSVNVNEPARLQVPTRVYAEDWIRAAAGVLIAVGLTFLLVGAIYLSVLVGPVDPAAFLSE
jgi:hypothetical protein